MIRTPAGLLLLALAWSGAGAGRPPPSPSPRRSPTGGSEPTFVSVTAGGSMTCALTDAGRAYCWGSNSVGQLGNRNPRERTVPVAVAGDHTFTTISAGDQHVCALLASGAAYCWGGNVEGALGSGGVVDSEPVPTPVAGGLRFASISAGVDRTCAVTLGGTAYCWGRYSSPSDDPVGRAVALPTPVPGTLRFRSIAVGLRHACGIGQDNHVYCWGQNDVGELGRGSPDLSRANQVPGPPTMTTPVASVSVSVSTSCAVTLDGASYCWGQNMFGQLGNGTSTAEDTPNVAPSRVVGDQKWRQISAERRYACAVTVAGAAYCWGENASKLLGSDSATERCGAGSRPRVCSTKPLPVGGGLPFRQVAAGWRHACGVGEDGHVYCWGTNEYGELGTGSYEASVQPARVVFHADTTTPPSR